MKRAQISMDTFILLAALAFAALVILLIVYPNVADVLRTEGEKGVCEWSLVMHSLAKLGDWSLIPAECKANRFEVTMDDLEKHKKEAQKRIKLYHDPDTKDKYEKIAPHFPNPDKDIYWQEWALNKIVAEEMKDCWQKVFKGQLPLFDQWWDFYSWDWEKVKPTDTEDRFSSFIGDFKGPPTNCIICSRIKLSDQVKKEFGLRININSLDAWLRANYPKTGGKSYYESLTEGQSELKSFFTPPYSYNINEPLAILYEKIYYYHGIEESLDKMWKFISGGKEGTYELNYLKLRPYTQNSLISQPKSDGTGGEGCTFILD